MEEDLHGPGIDAKGVAFPGVNLYVQLGHGRDYAWSATSAGQDIIDTFAVPLCDATHYRFRGQCLAIEVLERKNTWTPNLADQTPPGAETLHAERTKLGLVAGRGTYKGKQMLYTVLRSTYQHEVDSAVGFSLFNEPGAIRSPQDFQRAASNIGYTFNWFYIDAKHIAYFNSGNNPVRAKGTTGQLPMASTNEWRDFDPDLNTARYTPFDPAPAGRRPAGAHELEQPPGPRLRRRRLEPLQLGLPLADARSPARAAAEGRPQAHAARDGRRDGAGGHHRPARHDLAAAGAAHPGHAEGPRARRGRGQAQGVVGQRHAPHRPQPRRRLRRRRRGPDHGRLVAAAHPGHVPARHGQGACSTGSRRPTRSTTSPTTTATTSARPTRRASTATCSRTSSACSSAPSRRSTPPPSAGAASWPRAARPCESSLKSALGEKATDTYPADAVCKAGDQPCLDTVRFRPLGGVTQPLIPWINRPTYQQAVEVQGGARIARGPRPTAARASRSARPGAGPSGPGRPGARSTRPGGWRARWAAPAARRRRAGRPGAPAPR